MPFQLQRGDRIGGDGHGAAGNWSWGVDVSHNAAFNRAELPDLASQKAGCPVTFDFQINNERFFQKYKYVSDIALDIVFI